MKLEESISNETGPITVKRELDWELVKVFEHEHQECYDVWIAGYKLGAIIGQGPTQRDAILNTIQACAVLQVEMLALLEKLCPSCDGDAGPSRGQLPEGTGADRR